MNRQMASIRSTIVLLTARRLDWTAADCGLFLSITGVAAVGVLGWLTRVLVAESGDDHRNACGHAGVWLLQPPHGSALLSGRFISGRRRHDVRSVGMRGKCLAGQCLASAHQAGGLAG